LDDFYGHSKNIKSPGKVYAEVPPKVEYSMTEFGKTLEPVLLSLKQLSRDSNAAEDGLL
jgi:DNA-binding HxlR family transcriptional regulator